MGVISLQAATFACPRSRPGSICDSSFCFCSIPYPLPTALSAEFTNKSSFLPRFPSREEGETDCLCILCAVPSPSKCIPYTTLGVPSHLSCMPRYLEPSRKFCSLLPRGEGTSNVGLLRLRLQVVSCIPAGCQRQSSSSCSTTYPFHPMPKYISKRCFPSCTAA